MTCRRRLLQHLPLLAMPALFSPGNSLGQANPADGAGAAPALAAAELAIIVPPFLSPAALLDAVRPLREHLQRRLGRPVAVYSAPDYRTLYTAARQGAHPVVLLPAHVAALAMAEARYSALVAVQPDSELMLMVRADSVLQHLADLKGQRIGVLDPLSLTAITARQWLQQERLQPGRDVQILFQPTINSGVVALAQGELDALVMTSFQTSVLGGEALRPLRRLAAGPAMPAPLLLAHPELTPALVAQLRQALLGFTPDPQRPAAVFNAPMFALSAAQLLLLQGLVEPARELLR